MTPTDLKAALSALHWTPGDLAHHLGQSVNRVRNWVRPSGYRVPPEVAAWVLRRVAMHRAMMETDPPPRLTQEKR